MRETVFQTILLLALPASGKSEVRNFMIHMDPEKLQNEFHIGANLQLDDYPYVHFLRCIDTELEKENQPRIFYPSNDKPLTDGRDWATFIYLLNEDYHNLHNRLHVHCDSASAYLFQRIDRAASSAGLDMRLANLPSSVRLHIQQALEEQDIEKVYESYHRFFDHFDPENDLQEMADLATYSVSIGFYEEAKRALLRLTEVEPDEAIWTILLAEILVAEGETDQALSILYDIPETDPDYPSVLVVQSEAYREEGDFDLAEKKLLKAKDLEPDEAIIDFYLGTLLFEAGSFERSAFFLERFLKQNPEETGEEERAQELYVEATLRMGNKEPLEQFIGEESIDGLSSDLLTQMASYESIEGNYEKSLEYYMELLEREPENSEVTLNVIQCLLILKRDEEAKSYAKKWIAFDELNDEAHRILGQIEIATGNQQEGLLELKEAVNLNNDSILNVTSYVEALNEEEEYEESIAFLESLETKEDAVILYLFAKTYEAMEEYSEAFTNYQKAYEAGESSLEFYEDYIRFMIEEGRKEQAKVALQEALKLDPFNPEFIRYSFIFEE